MNNISILTIIVVLTMTMIDSSSLTNVLAKGKVTRGPVTCESVEGLGFVTCCQTETGSDGIEIKYCTTCDDTNPPSNCTPRSMWNPDSLSNPTTPGGKDIGQQQPLSPSKSNEQSSQNNGMNPQQALTASKSN